MVLPTGPGRGVRIRVTADTAKARQDIRRLNGDFKSVGNTAASATKNIARLATGIAAAFAGTALTRGINRATDNFVDMENQVALVVGRGEELAKQMDKIYRISLQTKAPVQSTAQAFNRMGQSLKGTGRSVQDINRSIITLNQAAAISGGSVESQRAAMVQLGQGLSSGTLRGEELNSVLEQLPRVATAIADNMGVARGALRGLAADGKLTSDVVFSALLGQSEAVAKEFENIELTSGKAFVLLGDQVGRLTADLSKALGITSSFTNKISGLTNAIAGNRESIVASVVEWRDRLAEIPKIIGRVVKDFVSGLGVMKKSLSSFDISSLYGGLEGLEGIYKGMIDAARVSIRTISDIIENNFGSSIDFIKDQFNRLSDTSAFQFLERTFRNVRDFAVIYLGDAARVVRDFASDVIEFFFNIYEKVVGNSYWTDTMEGIANLADKYLPVVLNKVKSFANDVTSAFKAIYSAGRERLNFDIDLTATAQSIQSIRQTIIDAVSGGFSRGVDAIRSLAPEIRKTFTTAILAAFTLAFSTGTITKAFGKIANKIGPVFLAVLVANLVEAVGSPKVFAAFGSMVGEVIGEAIKQIVTALPAIISGLVSALGAGLIGLFKEAGIAGSIAFIASFALLFPKTFKGILAAAALGQTFVDGLLGVSQRRTLKSRLVGLFSLGTTQGQRAGRGSSRRGRGGGTVLNPVFQPFFDAFSKNNLKAKVNAFGNAVRTNAIPAIAAMGGIVQNLAAPALARMQAIFSSLPILLRRATRSMGSFGKVGAASIAALVAGAGIASAGSGAGANEGATTVAALIGAIAAAGIVEQAVTLAGRKLGLGFAIDTAKSFGSAILGLLSRALLAIPTLLKGVVATLAFKIIAIITAAVVVGGIAYTLIFGEGDTFREKFDSQINYARRKLGLLNEATVSNAVDVRSTSRTIAARGQFGRNAFENRRNKESIETLNFQALSDVSAGKIIDSVNSLEAIQIKYNQEILTYGSATAETTSRLEAAQDRTTAAIDKAADEAANRDTGVTAALGVQNRPGFADFRNLLSDITVFLGGEQSDFSKQSDILANIAETLGEGPVTAEGLTRFASALQINQTPEQIESLFGEDIAALLGGIANRDPSEFSTEFTNSINELIVALSEERFGNTTLNPLQGNITNPILGLIRDRNVRDARSNFGEAARRNPELVARQRATENFENAVRALEDQSLNTLGNRSLISTSESKLISDAFSSALAGRGNLEDTLARRQAGDATDGDVARARSFLAEAETSLEQTITSALRDGSAQANFTRLADEVGDIIDPAKIAQIASDATSFGVQEGIETTKISLGGFSDISSTLTELENVREQMEAIGALPVVTNENARLFASLKQDEAELSKILGLLSQSANIQLFSEDLAKGEATRDQIIEVINSALTLKGISIDADKLLNAPDSLISNLGRIASGFLSAAFARNTLAAGGEVDDTTIDKEIEKLKKRGKALSDAISSGGLNTSNGGGDGGGGGTTNTPIQRLLSDIGLTIEGLIGLTGRETNSLFSSLKKIEAAEKRINNSALTNVGLRKQQLDIIRNQEAEIEKILSGGNVNSAEAAGFSPEVLGGGAGAIELQREINRIIRERGLISADNTEEIAKANNELSSAQTRLDSMLSTSQRLFDGFRDGLREGLGKIFKEGDLEGGIMAFADTFSSTVVDTFIDAFVTSLIETAGIKEFFDGITSSLFDILGGLGGGGGAGGGVLSGILSSAFSLFGFPFDRGGTVPLIPGAQVGKDSVPALLKPGEIVTTTQDARTNNRSTESKDTQVFNINITGDISRQTRKEVLTMIPDIAGGVRSHNREIGVY